MGNYVREMATDTMHEEEKQAAASVDSAFRSPDQKSPNIVCFNRLLWGVWYHNNRADPQRSISACSVCLAKTRMVPESAAALSGTQLSHLPLG